MPGRCARSTSYTGFSEGRTSLGSQSRNVSELSGALVPAQGIRPAVHGQAEVLTRLAVAEAAVNDRLRRVQGRDGFALRLVQVVQLMAHHRGEDAAAAMRGKYPHPR